MLQGQDLVLTDPFYNAPSNSFESELQPAIGNLWADQRTCDGVARLRYAFMTRAEALLHGDLHTGSVMGSDAEIKILDPEFCFFGPMGFDIGMFIANLFISAVAHQALAGTACDFAETMLAAASQTWLDFRCRSMSLLQAAPVWRLSTMHSMNSCI